MCCLFEVNTQTRQCLPSLVLRFHSVRSLVPWAALPVLYVLMRGAGLVAQPWQIREGPRVISQAIDAGGLEQALFRIF